MGSDKVRLLDNLMFGTFTTCAVVSVTFLICNACSSYQKEKTMQVCIQEMVQTYDSDIANNNRIAITKCKELFDKR
jgi:hypothetical protein